MELTNFSNVSWEIERLLHGDMKTLEALLKKHNLDGLELMLYEPWEKTTIPKELVRGIHLRFWPNWMDFWRQEKAALLHEYGTEDAWKKSFGSTKEEWVALWKEHICDAAKTNAEYVVFHVAQARPSEMYCRKYAYTDEEVIDATLELVNEVMEELPQDMTLLYENLWWPGLTLQKPELAEKLLHGTKHKNTGFMLDTGHIMNTCLTLDSERQAVEYILDTVEALGSLAEKIYGVHLNCALSGEFVREEMRKHPEALDRILTWEEAMNYIARTDWHEPFYTTAVREIVDMLQPRYIVHEFMQSTVEDWGRKLSQQRKSLGRA